MQLARETESKLKSSVGKIRGTNQDYFLVQCDTQVFHARRAVSCLLEPEPGDTVGLFENYCSGQIYIITILERQSLAPAKINFSNGLNLHSQAGKVSIHSNQALRLDSATSVDVSSPMHRVTSRSESHQTATFSMTSKTLFVINDTATMQSNKVIISARTLLQNLINSVRNVKVLEQLNAGNWIARITDSHNLHAKNSIHTAESDLKLDAKRIHMG